MRGKMFVRSDTRTDVSISLRLRFRALSDRLAQIHAEGVSCFASRTTCAPSHVAKVNTRGCPRLPRPAIRDLNSNFMVLTGIERCTSFGTSWEACPCNLDTQDFLPKDHRIA